MYERVDEKGKVFTPRVRTAPVEVEIHTLQGLVHGYVHVKPYKRVKDELDNREEEFLAVTNASMRTHPDSIPREVGFIAVNKHHIVTLVPIDEPHWPQDEFDGR
jgi:Family of unknown function (DUF6812)